MWLDLRPELVGADMVPRHSKYDLLTKREVKIAILTGQAWSIIIKDLLYVQKGNFFLQDRRGKSRAGKIGPSRPLG